MSSDIAPLLVGFAVVGLLLVLIGIVLVVRRLAERMRMRHRERRPGTLEGGAASQDWMYRPRARGERQPEPSAAQPTATDDGAGGPSTDRQQAARRRDSEAEAERITEEAHRRARELLEEAELEANRIVVAAGRERASRLDDQEESVPPCRGGRGSTRFPRFKRPSRGRRRLLPPSGSPRVSYERLRRKQRKADEISEDARRRAQELLEEPAEAKSIVAATGQERARLLDELTRERSVLEEANARLGSPTALQEAERKADEVLAAAEQQSEELRREREAESASTTKASTRARTAGGSRARGQENLRCRRPGARAARGRIGA
jgi:hypothetical protein